MVIKRYCGRDLKLSQGVPAEDPPEADDLDNAMMIAKLRYAPYVYDVDEVCNINTWKVNRDKVYDFFTEINNKYSKARPNDAHKFVSKIQTQRGNSSFF